MTAKSAYPFVTRRELAKRLETEPAFVRECALVLQARTEARAAIGAATGRASGWMSSEKAVAGRLVAKLRSGALNEADGSRLKKLVARYTRQLAGHFREIELRERPGLAEAAARFGVLPPGRAVPGVPVPEEPHGEPDEAPEEAADEGDGPESEQPDALAPRVLAFVGGSQGQRADEIARAVDVTTAMLGPTLRELVLGKKLMKRGVGRGTKYFVR